MANRKRLAPQYIGSIPLPFPHKNLSLAIRQALNLSCMDKLQIVKTYLNTTPNAAKPNPSP